MPGTKITLTQILVADPRHPHATAEEHNSVLVPHVKDGSVQVVSAEFAGGGRNEWALNILILEPLTEAENKQLQQERQHRAEAE